MRWMHFHTRGATNLFQLIILGSIFALHGITVGFEIAALAWGSAKPIESLTMSMSWIALIIIVYSALHKVTHAGLEYAAVRNIITFLALFCASLTNFIVFIARGKSDLLHTFASFKDSGMAASALVYMAACAVALSLLGLLVTRVPKEEPPQVTIPVIIPSRVRKKPSVPDEVAEFDSITSKTNSPPWDIALARVTVVPLATKKSNDKKYERDSWATDLF